MTCALRWLPPSSQDLDSLFALVIACLSGDCRTEEIERGKARVRENSHRNLELVRDIEREPGQGDALLAGLFHSSERIREHTFGMDHSARGMLRDSFYHQLEEPLNGLYAAARQAFAVVTADLRDQPCPPMPALRDRSLELEGRFADLRQARVTVPFAAEELMRFFSLLYRSRLLTEELSRSVEFANALDHASCKADNNSPAAAGNL